MSHIKSQKIILITGCLLTLGICTAYAKPPLPSGPAQKHDKHAPIEITSDTLEVFQSENKAIFTGHVVAIQAEDRLKGDQMIVYYKNQGEQEQAKNSAADSKTDTKADAKPPVDPNNPLNAGAIKKIDMKGSVFLSTPEETASGDYGDYEVDEQLIHLNDHVILTKGPNVLKGDKLVYNLDTGKSVVSSNGTPVGTDGKPQRVHALFLPESKDKDKDKNKPTAPAQPQSPVPPSQPATPSTPSQP